MVEIKNIEKEIASNLLKIKAIKLQPNDPFTWSSGWKSPIYCDNRSTLSYPELRDFIKKSFAEKIKENFPDVQKYGTEYQVNSMPLQPHQTDRINALQAQIYMMQAADIFKKNSKTFLTNYEEWDEDKDKKFILTYEIMNEQKPMIN